MKIFVSFRSESISEYRDVKVEFILNGNLITILMNTITKNGALSKAQKMIFRGEVQMSMYERECTTLFCRVKWTTKIREIKGFTSGGQYIIFRRLDPVVIPVFFNMTSYNFPCNRFGQLREKRKT